MTEEIGKPDRSMGTSSEQGSMCPMASMCKDFAGARQARWGLPILGMFFLVVGLLILVQPGFLVWLAGITTMVLGLLSFAGGVAMRRFTQRIECCQPG